MNEQSNSHPIPPGSPDMRLPDSLRGPLHEHFAHLRTRFEARGWGGRVGFGERPAVVVIDLALGWTQPDQQMGSNIDPIVDATCRVLAAARKATLPVFFTTSYGDPAEPPTPQSKKLKINVSQDSASIYQLDTRLERQPNEKIIYKKYASCFKGTNFQEMLCSLRVDTLIVTGVSTSHCVYATCRDAADSYHVIVPREAVGERCELMHETNLLDIDMELGDVMPCEKVVKHLEGSRG
jgi:nicotinamidase-related amidase